ncbi:unnamed protein product [marine sediment metagenome]|uniref:Uncharacterized protein n=1 Tax=marine sediment metagenome TaxID=412755 RepID=X1JSG6_9ZZZZ
MKHKCPAELNSKVVRISLPTYLLLKEYSLSAGITMAEAIDQLLTLGEPKASVEPTQTRLPIETIALSTPVIIAKSKPVTTAKSIPVTKAKSAPVTISISREVEHVTNGHR